MAKAGQWLFFAIEHFENMMASVCVWYKVSKTSGLHEQTPVSEQRETIEIKNFSKVWHNCTVMKEKWTQLQFVHSTLNIFIVNLKKKM